MREAAHSVPVSKEGALRRSMSRHTAQRLPRRAATSTSWTLWTVTVNSLCPCKLSIVTYN